MAEKGYPGAYRVHARFQQVPSRIRRICGCRRPGEPAGGKGRARREGWRPDHGRRVPGGQRVSRRLLDRRCRASGASLCDRRPGVRGAGTGRVPDEHADRSAAGDERASRRTTMTLRLSDVSSEHLLRELAPQVLGAVIRRFRDFATAEDAVQEALLAASMQWPREGFPDNPRGWLIRVASRRMIDHLRSDLARRRLEDAAATQIDYLVAPAVDIENET